MRMVSDLLPCTACCSGGNATCTWQPQAPSACQREGEEGAGPQGRAGGCLSGIGGQHSQWDETRRLWLYRRMKLTLKVPCHCSGG
jgi:hypothetical protein